MLRDVLKITLSGLQLIGVSLTEFVFENVRQKITEVLGEITLVFTRNLGGRAQTKGALAGRCRR